MEYYARTRINQAEKIEYQLVKEHLLGVAKKAKAYAQNTKEDGLFQNLCYLVGLLHDFGKYADEFQQRIRGADIKVKHAIHGAKCISNLNDELGLIINGHHSGIPDKAKMTSSDEFTNLKIDELLDRYELKEELQKEIEKLLKETFNLGDIKIRMIFSCLVNADHEDSKEYATQKPWKLNRFENKFNDFFKKLDDIVQQKSNNQGINKIRKDIYDECIKAAETDNKLVSLNAPTGSGKTFATMAYALKKASKFNYKRIIVVLPYISIIDQNAKIYKDIFGDDYVIEHHSGDIDTKDTDKMMEIWQDWDAPIIVTTSVRFFESIYSNKPRDLKKLHNIANSIIILDEVQTLPTELLTPILSAIKTLAGKWNTSFLFSTATQPAFEGKNRWQKETVIEILQNPQNYINQLKRVNYQNIGKLKDEELIKKLKEKEQALCVVNVKKHALKLYKMFNDENGIYYLSTLMCAKHRLKTINEIKERLKENKKCILISTQLIEAGVDLDFPTVYRAIGPLDSIIQSAGRCNREGKLTQGEVIVFDPEDNTMPPGIYRIATGKTKATMKACDINTQTLEAIKNYFNNLYNSEIDKKKIENLKKLKAFQSIHEEFKFIDVEKISIIVNYNNKGARIIKELKELLKQEDINKKEFYKLLQGYEVGLFENEFERCKEDGIIECINEEVGIYYYENYNPKTGLELPRKENNDKN